MLSMKKALAAIALAAGLGFASSSLSFADDGEPAAPESGALSEMVLGDPDAPILLLEYASVTCSHCAHWSHDVFPTIDEQYIRTGKIRYAVREFPMIPGHPALIARSYAGSMLARCAADKSGDMGYFAVLKTLFEEQESWAFGENPREKLIKIAASAGLSEADFDACIQRADLKEHIDDNMNIAVEKYELNGTPTFILQYHGEEKVVGGAELLSALEEAIAATR